MSRITPLDHFAFVKNIRIFLCIYICVYVVVTNFVSLLFCQQRCGEPVCIIFLSTCSNFEIWSTICSACSKCITPCNLCIPFPLIYSCCCAQCEGPCPRWWGEMASGEEIHRAGKMEIVSKIMYVGLGGHIACNAYQ